MLSTPPLGCGQGASRRGQQGSQCAALGPCSTAPHWPPGPQFPLRPSPETLVESEPSEGPPSTPALVILLGSDWSRRNKPPSRPLPPSPHLWFKFRFPYSSKPRGAHPACAERCRRGPCLPLGIGGHGGVDGHHGVVRGQQGDGCVPGRHTASASLRPRGPQHGYRARPPQDPALHAHAHRWPCVMPRALSIFFFLLCPFLSNLKWELEEVKLRSWDGRRRADVGQRPTVSWACPGLAAHGSLGSRGRLLGSSFQQGN